MALFFSSSEEATSIANPEECAHENVPFVRAIGVGILSSLLSTVVLVIIRKLHTREFKYEKNDEYRHKVIIKWKLLDALFVVLCLSYEVFCLTYVGLFLAQVTDRDRIVFFTSFMTALVNSWTAVPLCMAAVISLLLNVLAKEQTHLQAAEKELGYDFEDVKHPGLGKGSLSLASPSLPKMKYTSLKTITLHQSQMMAAQRSTTVMTRHCHSGQGLQNSLQRW